MSKAPFTRYEIQLVFEDGAYARWTSRKGVSLTRQELAEALRKILIIVESDRVVTHD